jgi:hypothetical protein
MKKLEKLAIEQLIFIYEKSLKEGLSEEVINNAKSIYNELIPGNTLLSDITNFAVAKLFAIAYPNSDPERKFPSKEEIKKILHSLKKRKQELE